MGAIHMSESFNSIQLGLNQTNASALNLGLTDAGDVKRSMDIAHPSNINLTNSNDVKNKIDITKLLNTEDLAPSLVLLKDQTALTDRPDPDTTEIMLFNFRQLVKNKEVNKIISFFLDKPNARLINAECIDLLLEDPDLIQELFLNRDMAEYFVTGTDGIVLDEYNLITNFSCRSMEAREAARDYMRRYLRHYTLEDQFSLLCACLSGKNPQLFRLIKHSYDIWSFEVKKKVLEAHKEFFKAFMKDIDNHEQLLRCVPPQSYILFSIMLDFDDHFVLQHLKTIKDHCKEDQDFLEIFKLKLDNVIKNKISNWVEQNQGLAKKSCLHAADTMEVALFNNILQFCPDFILRHPEQILKVQEKLATVMRDLEQAKIASKQDKGRNYFYINHETLYDNAIKKIQKILVSIEKHTVMQTHHFQTAVATMHSLTSPGLPRSDDDNNLYRKEMVTTWTPRCYTMEFAIQHENSRYHSWSIRSFVSEKESLEIRRQLEEAEKLRSIGNAVQIKGNGRRALPFLVSKNILSFLYPLKANKGGFQIEFIDTAVKAAATVISKKHSAA